MSIAQVIVLYNFRKRSVRFGSLKRHRRKAAASAKYVPLNSLTLSKITQLKPGNSVINREAQHASKLDHQDAPDDDNDNKDKNIVLSKQGYTTKPWWKQFPKKTKNKNAQILSELDKITETLPEWPWVNAISKRNKFNMFVDYNLDTNFALLP